MDAIKVEAVKLTPQQENYLELENHCCLCGTELIFVHEQNQESLKMKEQAHCPCCKIPLTDKEFSIQ